MTKGYDGFEELRPAPPARRHGCWFYGCITAAVLLVVAVVAAVLVVRSVFNGLVQEAVKYSDPAPMPLPLVELPPEQSKELHERIDAFRKALDAGEPAGPLVLTTDEVNALIAENPAFKGKVHVSLEKGLVRGRVSWPLEGFGLSALAGRYLNGVAVLKVSLENGVLIVTIDQLEVKGRPLPESFLASLRKENMAKDAYRNPENAELLRKLDRLTIEDGRVVVEARPRRTEPPGAEASPAEPPEPKAEAPREEAKEKAPEPEPAKEKTPEPAKEKAPEPEPAGEKAPPGR